MSASKVFLVQAETRFDSSKVEEFGTRVYLIGDDCRATIFNPDALVREMAAKLAENEYDPHRDFIALTGPSVSIALLLATAVARHPVVQVLIFDAKAEVYKARLVSVPTGVGATS